MILSSFSYLNSIALLNADDDDEEDGEGQSPTEVGVAGDKLRVVIT